MKKRNIYLLTAYIGWAILVLFTGETIRWLRLKNGVYSKVNEKIVIPVVEIQNPAPNTEYYTIVEHKIFTYSGIFPFIIKKEKTKINPWIYFDYTIQVPYHQSN